MKRRLFLRKTLGLSVAATCDPLFSTGSTEAAGPPAEPRPGRQAATGPLRRHERNPRYFSDGSGRAVYLTGSHTWSNLADFRPHERSPAFDFGAYLAWMVKLNHNFMRLWRWEALTLDTHGTAAAWRSANTLFSVVPHPWERTGPGNAMDGRPKFDLTRFCEAYFQRLRRRVKAAGERGIYTSVMLFEGWAMRFSPQAWQNHPFHPRNNTGDVNADADGDDRGLEIYTLNSEAITRLQEAYVRKVIDTVNDQDNVLYEICNEAHADSTAWQYHMINYVKDYQRRKPKQHPVGMTFQYPGGSNATLLESPADWISPNPDGGYRDAPPPADGRKVVLNDTDHLWGIGGNQVWVWKSFLRGHNPIFMDPYDGVVLGRRFDPKFAPLRRSLGHTLRFANRVNLAAMTPAKNLASTEYCLAGRSEEKPEYLVYLPGGGRASVDLSGARGNLRVEWFHPTTGKSYRSDATAGGRRQFFATPFDGDALLHLVGRE